MSVTPGISSSESAAARLSPVPVCMNIPLINYGGRGWGGVH